MSSDTEKAWRESSVVETIYANKAFPLSSVLKKEIYLVCRQNCMPPIVFTTNYHPSSLLPSNFTAVLVRRQAVGIPQGSVLSGLLCNFFFGYIEKRLLGDILDSPPLSAPPPTSSVKRDVPVMNRFNDSLETSSNGDGVRPCYGRDAETSAARFSGGCSRSSPWGVGESGLGTGARAAAGAESDCTSRLPGKTCGTAEAISDVSHGEGGAYSSACRSQREHPCEASSGETCGRRRTREDEDGGASGGGRPPFPHPEGDCTLLRQVDDFLLVTTSKEKAMAFVSAMHDKAKTGEWGFSVHEAKVSESTGVCLVSVPSGVLWREEHPTTTVTD